MAKVGRLQENSTKGFQSRFVIATELNCRMRTACGVKKKVISEVLRKYDVCVT